MTKQYNKKTIIDLIKSEAISTTEISQRTGFELNQVNEIVCELIKNGIADMYNNGILTISEYYLNFLSTKKSKIIDLSTNLPAKLQAIINRSQTKV